MNSVIVVAGGVGKRTGLNVPKQFVQVPSSNKRIIQYSIDEFIQNDLINEIIIVVHKNWYNTISSEFSDCKVVIGGETRFMSSYNGLKNCSSNCNKVLIHDAARPFITQNIINKGINYLDKYDAAIPVIDSTNSLVDISEKHLRYLDRNNIKSVQTPQYFIYNKIFDAYKNANIDNEFTDDMSVLLDSKPNCTFKYFSGINQNFKITTSKDLEDVINLLK